MLTKASVQSAFASIRASLPTLHVRLASGRAIEGTQLPLFGEYAGYRGGTDPGIDGGVRLNVADIEPERIGEGDKLSVMDERGDWVEYRAISTRYDEVEATVLVIYGDITE